MNSQQTQRAMHLCCCGRVLHAPKKNWMPGTLFVPCDPPRHHFGWWRESSLMRMCRTAELCGIRLRVSEAFWRDPMDRPDDVVCEVWAWQCRTCDAELFARFWQWMEEERRKMVCQSFNQ